jgi:hypothetical protein
LVLGAGPEATGTNWTFPGFRPAKYHSGLDRLETSGRTAEATALNVLTAGSCLFFLGFAATRAAFVPLTYDEAATYLRYIESGFLSVFSFDVATNHFLNTLLTKIFYLAGGDSELVLRMPNLIGYGMYMWFSLLILRRLTHRVIAFGGFLLLNLNLYVLDYFSLSRGYGLSLGFLMGTLFFLFRFLTQLHAGAATRRDLFRALLLACAAVMANFSLLNVYLGVFVVGLVALIVFNSVTDAPPATGADGRSALAERRRSFPWLPLVAVIFTLLVLSQDFGLSEKLYEPVEVRLVGLNEAELDAAMVSRIDVRDRATGLSFDSGAMVWRTAPPNHIAGLRIELPVAAADKLTRIEVIADGRRFTRDESHDGGWKSRDAGATRVLESNPSLSLPRSRMPGYRSIMNWAGDGRYLAYLTGYTALALSALGALAILLKVLGRLAVRANLLRDDQWRPLASGALWLAALAGCPLYLLRRNGELYYGGTQGLIPDTFYSVISNSFYDRAYSPAQAQIAFGVAIVTIAAFGVVLYVSYRRRNLPRALPGVCVLAIMIVASVASIAERFLFQTPYPLGRTALFYLPLYALFLTFFCEALAGLGRAGEILATGLLVLALSCSTYHFTTNANTKYALDWWRDSGTKAMMEDLGQIVAAERPGSRVVLGVDRGYSAVAAFYAAKNTSAHINIVVVPTPSDFVYVDDGHQSLAMEVIKRYPVAGSVLARAGTIR